MARTGGYRGKGSYGTSGQIAGGGARNVSLRGPASPQTRGASVSESMDKVAAMMDKRAAEIKAERAAKAEGRSAPAPAAAPAPEPVAQPMSTPEERWINRARAGGDDIRTDAELRQQYRDRVAARDAKLQAAAPKTEPAAPDAPKPKAKTAKGKSSAKAEIAHLDGRIENARASMSIGKPSDADIARTNALISDLERQKAALAPKAKPAKAPRKPAPSAIANARYGSDFMAPDPARAAALEAAARQPKAPSAARQGAIDTYKSAFGHEPPARMSAKAMKAAVENRAITASRIAQQDAMMDRLLTGEQRVAEIAARRSFQKKFGHAPPAGMTPDAMARWTESGMTKAPAPPGAYGPVGSHGDRTGGGDAHRNSMTPTPTATPPAPPSIGQMAKNAYAKAAMPLAVMSVGIQAVGAYNRARDDGADTGRAVIEGVKAAAVPTAMIGAVPALNAIGRASSLGMIATGAQVLGKAAGRLALPAVVGWSAYQGAQEDKNTLRGAVRGAIRGLDPSAIFMARGLGERAFDGAFGQATPKTSFWDTGPRPPFMDTFQKSLQKMRGADAGLQGSSGRLNAEQKKQFAVANAAFGQRALPAPEKNAGGEKAARGWANPAVQMAAQEARGVVNVTDWAQSGENYDGNSLMTRGR